MYYIRFGVTVLLSPVLMVFFQTMFKGGYATLGFLGLIALFIHSYTYHEAVYLLGALILLIFNICALYTLRCYSSIKSSHNFTFPNFLSGSKSSIGFQGSSSLAL